MIKIENFITEAFNNLVNNFPSATILYQKSEISDTHFFRITPISISDSESFIEHSLNLTDKFYDQGFDGMICFLTKNSLTELKQPTKQHLPSHTLIQKASLFDESSISFSNIFVKNDEGILRTMEYSYVKNINTIGNVGNPNFAMAA